MKVITAHPNVRKFIHGSDIKISAKIDRLLRVMEEHEAHPGMPYSKSLGDGLFELRTLGKLQARIIYAFRHPYVVLLHGFYKRTRQISISDLRLAKTRLSEFDLL